jgi:hypothetical protein
MKRLVPMVVVSALCLGLVSCVCPKSKSASCPATKSPVAAPAGVSVDQCPVLSKLNLSDAQKVEVQKICDKCTKSECSKKACKKMTKELEKVLTPEQMTQFKAACDEMKGKSGCSKKAKKDECPMKKSDQPAEESK